MGRAIYFSTLHQTGAPIVRSHGRSWSLGVRAALGSAFGSGLLTGSRGVGTRGSQCCRVACAWVANSKMRIASSFMVFLCLQAIAHGWLILAQLKGFVKQFLLSYSVVTLKCFRSHAVNASIAPMVFIA